MKWLVAGSPLIYFINLHHWIQEKYLFKIYTYYIIYVSEKIDFKVLNQFAEIY